MPMGPYPSFTQCVAENQDKEDPNAYCGEIKKRTEDKDKGNPKKDGSGQGVRANYNRGGCNDLIPPECLVKAYRHYKGKFPDLNERDLLDKSFAYFKDNDTMDFVEDMKKADTFDMIFFDIVQEYEQQIQDFMQDAYAQPRIPSSQIQGTEVTHLQELQQQQQQYEQLYRQGMKSRPFELTNTETGAIVRGSVLESFRKNIKQLTPVSSSNVRGVGQFKNELLVQFHGDERVARRTYRYQMESPEMAEEAYRNLTATGSPGRWIWENARGHSKGEATGIKNVPNKYGSSLSPPGQGKKVIGGTSASLVEYSISNRVPVSRVSKFEEMSKQLRRKTSNISTNPNIGSRLEGELAGRRQARDRGVEQLREVKHWRQLPKIDFNVKLVGDSFDELLAWVNKTIKPKDAEEAKQITFAIMNKSQVKATEKAKKPYIEGKYYDISALKRNLTWGERYRLEVIKDAVETFPKKLFNRAKPEILIVSEIPDHPNWKFGKGKIPRYYQEMGIDRTFEEVSGCYDPYRNECIISLKNTINQYTTTKTIHHEIAHSVWEYGGVPIHLKQRLVADLQYYRDFILKKYYHSPTEMFALLFEIDGDEKTFRRKAKIENDNAVKSFLKTYKRMRSGMD